MFENEQIPYLHDKARRLPLRPGVYLMHDKKDTIIYVGKAKVLRNRVSQYFTSPEKHHGKTRRLVSKIHDFEFIVCDSEFEALTLECSLIKQHRPKYNILMKDAKGFNYIHITEAPFQQIRAAYQRDEAGEYLGPYTSHYAVRNVVDVANEVFMLPTCSRQFPRDFGKGRPCLNYHIKTCMGLCRGKVSEEEYSAIFDEALEFLRSGQLESIELLTKRMNAAAEAMDFEHAAKYRDRIRSIQKITDKQKVINSRILQQDVFGFVLAEEQVSIAVLKFRNGTLVDKQDFLLENDAPLPQLRREFLLQYYADSADIPPYAALDGEAEDAALIEQYLTENAGRRVHLFTPQRGEQVQLVQLALTNATERIALDSRRTGHEVAALDELAKLLGLPAPPKYIECYDISHFAGDNMVAGMVVFEDGRPLKSAYRKFAIKTLEQQDDYAAMREVLDRRLQRYFSEQGTDNSFARLPDLILLDGGKGHVSAILPIIAAHGLQIPVFGMVKDSKHRTRAIAVSGGEIAISSNRNAFTLVTKMQDEVHRFSIAYQKNRAAASMIDSELQKIRGVGEATVKKLMLHFRTLDAVRKASEEQLTAAGITKTAAANIYRHLHDGESVGETT